MATYGGSIAQGYVDALNQMEARKAQAAQTALAQQAFEQNQAAAQAAQLQARQQAIAQQNAGQAFGQMVQAPPQVPVRAMAPPQAPMPGQPSVPIRPAAPPQALPNAPGGAAPPTGVQGAPMPAPAPMGPAGPPQVPVPAMGAPGPGGPAPLPPYTAPGAPPGGSMPGAPQVPLQGPGTPPPAAGAGPGEAPPPITQGISLDSMAKVLLEQGVKGQQLYQALMTSMPLLDARGKEQMAMINAQLTGQGIDRQTAADLERARHNRATEAAEAAKLKQMGGATGEPLTDDAMEMRAFNRLINGKYPPGMGKDAVHDRRGVDNQAAALAKKMGISMEAVAMLPMQGKSDAGALYKLTQIESGIANAQGAMIRNGRLAVELAKKIAARVDFPKINNAILAGQTQFGDVDTSNYALALNAFKREYERAFAGPLSIAMLPVEAMKQGDKLFPPGITPDQLEGAINTLQRDVENVKLSAEEQANVLRERLRDPIRYYAQGAMPAGTPGATPAGAAPAIDRTAIEAELRRRKALP